MTPALAPHQHPLPALGPLPWDPLTLPPAPYTPPPGPYDPDPGTLYPPPLVPYDPNPEHSVSNHFTLTKDIPNTIPKKFTQTEGHRRTERAD